MKKLTLLTISVFLSILCCSSIFAKKINVTASLFSDNRIKTWISENGKISEHYNYGNVKTGIGPAVGFFHDINEQFEFGFETKMLIRKSQKSEFYFQAFSTANVRWKFFRDQRCLIFLDYAVGPVLSYLYRDSTSWGCDFELGTGIRFNLANEKYLIVKTNFVGILEKHSNSVSDSETVFVLSSQPISIGFSRKFR